MSFLKSRSIVNCALFPVPPVMYANDEMFPLSLYSLFLPSSLSPDAFVYCAFNAFDDSAMEGGEREGEGEREKREGEGEREGEREGEGEEKTMSNRPLILYAHGNGEDVGCVWMELLQLQQVQTLRLQL